MEDVGVCEWIRRCSARLQAQWRTVDPEELEQVAVDLLRDARLRAMPPEQAAVAWLSLGVLLQGGCEPGEDASGESLVAGAGLAPPALPRLDACA
ncbi:hypothetical protein BurJ1DRAFT_3262 [Burkholderiales bacterium JOSHI_001]|nr:hypothetical protein BurJ1DRAFT_3262 [Burkholderiales bacterium JOSHI_001]